jgi:hypothetical protein
MSKLVYLCFRNQNIEQGLVSNESFKILEKRLLPDNIQPNPLKLISADKIIAAIFNPMKNIMIDGGSICLGSLMKPYGEWYKPLGDIPDGNYALIRSNEKYVEIISDVVASRTMWYYHDEDIFIGSTSQRAIIYFLKSFQINREAIAWLISSGRLGYGVSWDERIKKVDGDSCILLDRNTWKVSIKTVPVELHPDKITMEESAQRLLDIYIKTFDRYDLEPTDWILPLSGGHDSRLILLMMKEKQNLKCLSWGRFNALNDNQNDAYIAKILADHFGCEYMFYPIETKDEYIEQSLERFVINSEGRIDSITAYMDGFETWRKLFSLGVNGILRGDVGYNSRTFVNESQGRQLHKIRLISDYDRYIDFSRYDILPQKLPDVLKKQGTESLGTYNYRLHHLFNLPYNMAALNDIKLSYVEVNNPQLTRSILYEIRRIPDELLYNKKVHKMVVSKLSPNIGFAVRSAPEHPRDILHRPKTVEFIRTYLNNSDSSELVPNEFVRKITKGMSSFNDEKTIKSYLSSYNIKRKIKKMVSIKNKQILSAYVKAKPEYNVLALRLFIILKTYKMLKEDASTISIN